jgi:hypothetical protein
MIDFPKISVRNKGAREVTLENERPFKPGAS